MPKQKDLKRLVRSRMKKTGEAYTAARAQLIRKKASSRKGAVPAAGDSAAVAGASISGAGNSLPQPASGSSNAAPTGHPAGMSDAAVRASTGRGWAQWVQELDAIDAVRMSHREIAARLREAYGIGSWWAQAVTVGYERIKGLREPGQRRSGHYELTKSRTFPVPVEVLYRAFSNTALRKRWLGDIDLTVRKATPSRSLRITWPDGTNVDIGLAARGPNGEKSQAAIEHGKLRSREEAAERKAWWTERLDWLAEILRAGSGK